MHPCFLIGIAGGSCVGKGYLCTYIQDHVFPWQSLILPIDAYYRDLSHIPSHQRNAHNFDVPDAIDQTLLIQHLGHLVSGGTVDVPEYDFATHTRSGKCRGVSAHGKIILVEGLFALYWEEVRQLLSAKVFLDLDSEKSLTRRIERDVRERGRSAESVKQQFRETVLPMYDRYIAPTRRFADLVLSADAPIAELGVKVAGLIPEGRGLWT